MNSPNLPYWLAAIYLPDTGPRTVLNWLTRFSDIKTIFQTPEDELRLKGLSEQHIRAIQQPDWRQVDAALNWAQTQNQHIVALDDVFYPAALKEISDPPLVLFVRGDKTALANRQLAMVGSRHATPAGLANAEYFARLLAEAGLTITSGLALGVDGASHRGALAGNGITIGVAGTGLHYIYPARHKLLAEEIMQKNGAVISEFPLHTAPRAANFPRRNRIIAGLSEGVLVVEAAVKSGSLITARHALEHGREVFAIPGSIHNPLARGCHHLIRQGAKLMESIDDIIEELGHLRHSPAAGTTQAEKNINALSPACRQILVQIEYEITSLDVILLRSGLTAGEVSSILLILELHGYIQSVPGGYVRAILNQ